jgi:AAA ATPase domain
MKTDQQPELLAVEVRNFKGVRFARIDFKKAVTVLGGKNSAGKTSLLDGLRSAFETNRNLPADPIHDDADQARLFVDLGTMTIEKVITATPEGPKTKVTVRDVNGDKVSRPQEELAEHYDSLCFDPSMFVTMSKDEQDRTLKDAIGLDLSDIERDHAAKYQERTEVGREVKRLEGRFSEKTHFPDAPAEETTTAEVLAELERHDRWAAEVNALSEEHAKAKREEERAKTALDEAAARHVATLVTLSAAAGALKTAPVRPTAPRDELKSRAESLDATNKKVRSNKDRATIGSELQTKRAKVDELTLELKRLDDAKKTRISESKFPIEGLGFDELGPSLNGHPLKQCGEAELWSLSCALCMAKNPKLKFALIRRGSQLDDDAMLKLQSMAQERGFRLLIEVVTRKPEDELGVDVMMRNGIGEQRT